MMYKTRSLLMPIVIAVSLIDLTLGQSYKSAELLPSRIEEFWEESADSYSFSKALDFDGDGIMDIIVATDREIAAFRGTRAGVYEEYALFEFDIGAVKSVAVGDINGDTYEDIVFTSDDGCYQEIIYVEHFPEYGFIFWDWLSVDSCWDEGDALGVYQKLSIEDLDGDGDLDVVAAGEDFVCWYPNNEPVIVQGFRWGYRQIIGETDNGSGVEAVDIDNDGDVDVLAPKASGTGEDLVCYKNNGHGVFPDLNRSVVMEDVGDLNSVELADLDQDGFLDVFFSSTISFSGNEVRKIGWCRRESESVFSEPQTIAIDEFTSCDAHLCDYDNDGIKDVVLTRGNREWGRVCWQRNQGSGVFSSSEILADYGALSHLLSSFEDLDGDGDRDLLLVGNPGNPYTPSGMWLECNSTGEYVSPSWIDLEIGETASSIDNNVDPLVGDFDLDGVANDVLYAKKNGGLIFVVNDGGGSSSVGVYGFGEETTELSKGDFDGDGDEDIIQSTASKNVFYIESLGDGSYAPPSQLFDSTGSSGAPVTVAGDFNGDGSLDLLVSGVSTVGGQEGVHYLENDGAGNLSSLAFTDTPDSDYLKDVKACDLNGDSHLDIVFLIGRSVVSMYGDSTGGFTDENFIFWDRSAFDVGDLDGDGDSDIGAGYYYPSDHVTFAVNNGFGGLHEEVHEVQIGDFDVRSVFFADLTGTGDEEFVLLSVSASPDVLAFDPNGGDYHFEKPPFAVSGWDLDKDVDNALCAVDYDQDGDVDLLMVAEHDHHPHDVELLLATSFVFVDCNNNDVDDSLDPDLNGNGIPDDCECWVTNFCTGELNTTGLSGKISISGTTFVSLNDLTLTASDVPPNQFGIFYYGPNQVNEGLGDPFGEGRRCVGGQTVRLPVVNTGSGGSPQADIDNTLYPHSQNLQPGSTWNFQFWFRDPSGGPVGFNLTDALSITFCP